MTTLSSRIELGSFFAETADPALLESADRGQTELLDYRQLYELWERQQWLTQELDFSEDREHWRGFPDEERFQRMYGLSSFFIGEQKVTEELGPMMRAAPTQDMQVFLATQIADEARHVRFFDRFYAEVGVLESDNLAARLKETEKHLNPAFNVLFDEMLGSRVRTLAEDPTNMVALVEAITLYHMVIEGMLALTGQHYIIDFNEREGTLPGFVRGLQLRRARRAPPRRVRRALPARRGGGGPELQGGDPAHAGRGARDRGRGPHAAVGEGPAEDYEFFGVSVDDTRDFAAQALTRRLKVIGMVPAGA